MTRWRHVRALSKFIKLNIDVQKLPRGAVPEPDDLELASAALDLFRRFDKDKNQVLDYHEFRSMLLDMGVSHANLHRNVVERYVRTLDLNKDTVISFGEFLAGYRLLLIWDRDRFSLRAPLIHRSAVSSPQLAAHVSEPPLDDCPRISVPAVLVGDVPFAVSERYKLDTTRILGRGAYGIVAAASDERTGQRVVVKRVPAVGHPIELQATMRELLILRHIRRHPHDNLVHLLDITPPLAGPLDSWDALYLVMPRMDCDLHAIIRSNQPLTDEHCQFFAYQLLRGLLALHSCGVLHRDLKPSNLLVNKDCTLRIADFGISRVLGSADSTLSVLEADGGPRAANRPLTNYVVTRYYRAPELLLESRLYGFPVDVWSVGAILAEMILRRPLACGSSSAHQLEILADLLGPPSAAEQQGLADVHKASAARLALLTACPLGVGADEWQARTSRLAEVLSTGAAAGQQHGGAASAIELITRMLHYLPADRISVADALEHGWLSELHACNEEPRLPPIMMPALPGPGRGVSREQLQLLAIESVRELQAASAPAERCSDPAP